MICENQIADKLKEIVRENVSAEIQFNEGQNVNLLEAHGFNSVMMVEMIIAIESEFNIEIEDDYLRIDLFSNLESLKNLVIKHL